MRKPVDSIRFYFSVKLPWKYRDFKTILKHKIYNWGRKKKDLPSYCDQFLTRLLQLNNEFHRQTRTRPDIIVLRNKAAAYFVEYKLLVETNTSYIEHIFDIPPKSILSHLTIVTITEPCVEKHDIEMRKYGTNLRFITRSQPEDEIGHIEIQLHEKCDNDILIYSNI